MPASTLDIGMGLFMLKEKLLELELVLDNKYLDKYCELIENHKNDKKISCKTQKHHIVPQYYYKDKGLKINSKKENIVNLSHKNHALAHYYLCLCSVDKYIYKNECALEYILGHNYKKINKEQIIKQLDKYQEVFEDFCYRDKTCYIRKTKPVAKYNKDTLELIKEYPSIFEAANDTKININSIRACKNGKQYTAGGYIWKDIGKKPEKIIKKHLKQKHIIQYNKDTLTKIKEWDGVSLIEKELGFNKNSIKDCCLNKMKTYKGFIWRYIDSNIPLVTIKQRKQRASKKVYMFNLKGEFLEEFSGANEVTKKFENLSYSGVQRCCNAATLTYKKYIFLYEKNKINERIEKINNSKIRYNTKNVYLYDLNGNFINKFNSITEASTRIGVSESSITKSCCNKVKRPKRFIWRFKKEKKIEIKDNKKIKENKPKKIILIAYDKNNNKIGEWSKIKDAVKDTGVSYNRIANCCVKYYEYVDGYKFVKM